MMMMNHIETSMWWWLNAGRPAGPVQDSQFEWKIFQMNFIRWLIIDSLLIILFEWVDGDDYVQKWWKSHVQQAASSLRPTIDNEIMDAFGLTGNH